ARRDAPLEKIPVDLRGCGAGLLLAAADRRLRRVAVTEHLEANELVYVTGRQGSLVELHPKLLHPNRGNIDHRLSPERPWSGGADLLDHKEADFTERLPAISTVFWNPRRSATPARGPRPPAVIRAKYHS